MSEKNQHIIKADFIPVVTRVNAHEHSSYNIETGIVKISDIRDLSYLIGCEFPAVFFKSQNELQKFFNLLPSHSAQFILVTYDENGHPIALIKPDEFESIADVIKQHRTLQDPTNFQLQRFSYYLEDVLDYPDVKERNYLRKLYIEAMSHIWTLFKESNPVDNETSSYFHELNHTILVSKEINANGKNISLHELNRSPKLQRILLRQNPNTLEQIIQKKYLLLRSTFEAIASAHELLSTHHINHPDVQQLKKRTAIKMAELLFTINKKFNPEESQVASQFIFNHDFASVVHHKISGLLEQHSIGSIMLLLCSDKEVKEITDRNDLSNLFAYANVGYNGKKENRMNRLLNKVNYLLSSNESDIFQQIRSQYDLLNTVYEQLLIEIDEELSNLTLSKKISQAFKRMNPLNSFKKPKATPAPPRTA